MRNLNTFTVLSDYKGISPISQKYGKKLTTLIEIIDFVKNNPIKEKILEARKSGKGTDLYQKVKESCPQILWNANFLNGKKTVDITGVTGYIYGDIDSFGLLQHIDEAKRVNYCKNVLIGLPYVVMVCDSFGGKGISFLVKCSKLTVENFANVWFALEADLLEKGLELDRATKNLNRQCTLSYDENLYFNDEAVDYEPENLEVFNPKVQQDFIEHNNVIAEDDQFILADKLIEKSINEWQPDAYSKERYFDRTFFVQFAAKCNRWGIRKEAAMTAILKYCTGGYFLEIEDKPIDKIQTHVYGIYNTYPQQFGKFQVRKPSKYTNTKTQGYKYEIAKKIEFEVVNALFYYKFNNKDYITTLAKTCKKQGILKQDLITFLTNASKDSDLLQKMKIEEHIEKWEEKVTSVYGNPSIIFGSSLILTKEDREMKLACYLKFIEKNGFIIDTKHVGKTWDDIAIKRHLNQLWSVTTKGCTSSLFLSEPHTCVYLLQMFLEACVKINIPVNHVKGFIHNELSKHELLEPVMKPYKVSVLSKYITDNHEEFFVKKDSSNINLAGLWARYTNPNNSQYEETVNIGNFVQYCAENGVPKFELVAFFDKIKPQSNNKHWFDMYTLCDYLTDEHYRINSWKMGYDFRKGITSDELLKNYKVDKSYTLDDNSRISDLPIELYDNMLVWASPGTGKTTWICKYFKGGKRIILVPVTGALENIESTYGCSVFFEDRKTAKEGDDLIVCTYSSFPKFYKEVLKNWENGGLDYNLVFDEDHNFAVSAAPDFRGNELNEILHFAPNFKRFIRLSGTPFPIVNSFLDKSYVYKVKKMQHKVYKDVYYTDVHQSLLKRLERGKQNLIFLQNKKQDGKLGELIEFLKMNGFTKMAIINAGEKKSAEYKNLIINERLQDDVEIIICTSVMVEALNIMNDNCATAHFLTFGHHIYVEQLVNRFRNKLPDMTFFYRSEKSFNKENKQYDYINVVETQCLQQDVVDSFLAILPNNYARTQDGLSATKLMRQQISLFSKGVRIYNFSTKRDDLAIAYHAFKREEMIERSNPEFMEAALGMYDWKKVGEEHDVELKQAEQIVKLKEFKQMKKNEKAELIGKIVADVTSPLDLQKYGDTLKPQTEEDQLDYDFRRNVNFLTRYFVFDDALKMVSEWAIETGMSKGIWERMMRQLNIAHAKTLPYFSKNKLGIRLNWFNPQLQIIVSKFKKRKNQVVSYESYDKFVSSYAKLLDLYCQKEYAKLYASKTEDEKRVLFFNLLSSIFNVEKVLNVDNSYSFKINGLNSEEQISAYNNLVVEWLEKQKFFSSEEVVTFLLEIQSHIPYFQDGKTTKGKIKIDANGLAVESRMSQFAAMVIIHDFCEAKHQSARKEADGKTTKLYGVLSHTPNWLAPYSFLPSDLSNDNIDMEWVVQNSTEEKSL